MLRGRTSGLENWSKLQGKPTLLYLSQYDNGHELVRRVILSRLEWMGPISLVSRYRAEKSLPLVQIASLDDDIIGSRA